MPTSPAERAAAAPARRACGSVEGVAIGPAVLHEPRVEVTPAGRRGPAGRAGAPATRRSTALRERARPDAARPATSAGGEQREVLEAYRMFAQDRGWLRRIARGDRAPASTAEAAVQTVQEETRVRMAQVSDPYLRERLHRPRRPRQPAAAHLVGQAPSARPGRAAGRDHPGRARPRAGRAARVRPRASCAAWCSRKARRPRTSTIVARAFDIPMVGRVEGAMAAIEPGDLVVVDGDNGQRLRPAERRHPAGVRSDAIARARRAARDLRRRSATLPAVTRDGIAITLSINAGAPDRPRRSSRRPAPRASACSAPRSPS